MGDCLTFYEFEVCKKIENQQNHETLGPAVIASSEQDRDTMGTLV